MEIPATLASLRDGLAAATPVETAIVVAILASLLLVYYTFSR